MRKSDMPELLYATLDKMGGSGSIVDVCKRFWTDYGDGISQSDDLFYTWQYDIRWAATTLRKAGKMKDAHLSERGIWELV